MMVAVVSYRDTPAGLPAVPTCLMAFLRPDLLRSTSRLGCCFHAKQTGEEHPDELGSGHSVHSYLCLHGISVSHGEGACLAPESLSPALSRHLWLAAFPDCSVFTRNNLFARD